MLHWNEVSPRRAQPWRGGGRSRHGYGGAHPKSRGPLASRCPGATTGVRAYHGVTERRSSTARGTVRSKQGQTAVGDGRRCSTLVVPRVAAPSSLQQQQQQRGHLLNTPRHPHRPRGPAAAAQPPPTRCSTPGGGAILFL
jgi:hypothetical protein